MNGDGVEHEPNCKRQRTNEIDSQVGGDLLFEVPGDGGLLTTVESLVEKRTEARRMRDFQLADQILKHLLSHSIRLLDNPDGTSTILDSSPPSSSSSSSSSTAAASSSSEPTDVRGLSLSGRRRAAKNSATRQKQSRHRFAIFASFIEETFSSAFAEPAALSSGRILDIAGGSGELSWRLARKGFTATVVDPRPLTFTRVATEKILSFRPEPSEGDASLLPRGCVDGKRRDEMTAWLHAKTLRVATVDGNRTNASLEHFLALPIQSVVSEFSTEWTSNPLLQEAQVIVGLHPDQATEAIVDVAIATEKPFAIVPCCVFPGLFPDRQLAGLPVTSYEQFLDYLQAKSPAIQRREVGGLGQRKIILFAVPPYLSPAGTREDASP